MKPALLLLAVILLIACAPAQPAANIQSTVIAMAQTGVALTQTALPTFTPTVTVTPTITLTPTPSLPTEVFTSIAGREFEIRGDHIWVNVDGEWQDWFQKTFDGKDWRKTDAKLIADAPNQQWWSNWFTYDTHNEGRTMRGVWLVVPEPDEIAEVQVVSTDNVIYTVRGPWVIIPDKNDINTIHRLIYPLFISASDGYMFEWKVSDLCRADSGCSTGFTNDYQYEIGYDLFTRHYSQYPNILRRMKIDQAQGFRNWIDRMFNGEINVWPEDLVLQGYFIYDAQPLRP